MEGGGKTTIVLPWGHPVVRFFECARTHTHTQQAFSVRLILTPCVQPMMRWQKLDWRVSVFFSLLYAMAFFFATSTTKTMSFVPRFELDWDEWGVDCFKLPFILLFYWTAARQWGIAVRANATWLFAKTRWLKGCSCDHLCPFRYYLYILLECLESKDFNVFFLSNNRVYQCIFIIPHWIKTA